MDVSEREATRLEAGHRNGVRTWPPTPGPTRPARANRPPRPRRPLPSPTDQSLRRKPPPTKTIGKDPLHRAGLAERVLNRMGMLLFRADRRVDQLDIEHVASN
ncbi:MAG: hypothetical protein U0231_13765 [Nitrospiraceae bacterium]